MNTNKTGLEGFQKSLHPYALYDRVKAESSLSIGRANIRLFVF